MNPFARALLLGVLTAVAAVPTATRAASEAAKAVVAEGLAAVVVDPVTARDRAIVDAKRKAVEEVAGLQVDARAVYEMGLSQEDWLRVQSFGFVERYQILEEKPGKDRYAVKLEAWVRGGAAGGPEAAKQFLSQRSFLVAAEGEGAAAVAQRLKAALVDRGFQVYDEQLTGALRSGGGAGSVLSAATRFLADYLVRVESSVGAMGETYGIKAFQGAATIEMTEVSSGFLQASVAQSARVYGLTRQQAVSGQRADQFPRAVAGAAVDQFLAKLDDLKVGAAKSVRLVLESPSSQDAFERLVSGVVEVRWVQSPHDRSYASDRAVVFVDYPEKVVYLAADLDYLPGFAVVSYGPGYVVLREEG